ncbi:MAG: hypothetical protein A2Y33_08750 [Spirochaetes bacterium GWF1_51_8]|nr:MAG: hypothetical protein A2Y33_08750 [Spirochaetes bacterium GWF1_51_8]
MKTIVSILFLIFLFSSVNAIGHKIRFMGGASYLFLNEFNGSTSVGPHAGFEITYILTPKTKLINTEMSIGTLYHYYPGNPANMQTIKFGLGIRVHLNISDSIRPYFDHQVHSGIVSFIGNEGYAQAYMIKLGLGADFPLFPDVGKESDSIFFDISYNFFHLNYFGQNEKKMGYLGLNIGYSLCL